MNSINNNELILCHCQEVGNLSSRKMKISVSFDGEGVKLKKDNALYPSTLFRIFSLAFPKRTLSAPDVIVAGGHGADSDPSQMERVGRDGDQ